jgi:hypothetical protein
MDEFDIERHGEHGRGRRLKVRGARIDDSIVRVASD